MTNDRIANVLVTGAAGWLGSNLVGSIINGLSDGPDLPVELTGAQVTAGVFGSDIADLDTYNGRVEWLKSDIRNRQETDRLFANAPGAIVINCAGLIHPRRIKELYEVNVEGTLNVISSAADNGSKRVVVVSSNSPIGASNDNQTIFDENSPYNPYMNYGRSKMLMEMKSRELASELGIELVLIRVPWFYGPKQPARQATFFSMIRNGKAPVLGSGNNRRSMAYVDNISQGLILASTVPAAAGNTYWIADEVSYSWNEIIDTVERLLNDEFDLPCKTGRLQLPRVVGTVVRIADSLIQQSGFYNQKLHVLSEVPLTIACDVSKAKYELGFEPRISLDEGMRRSIRSALDSGTVI